MLNKFLALDLATIPPLSSLVIKGAWFPLVFFEKVLCDISKDLSELVIGLFTIFLNFTLY